jgi:DeoR family transcriptional regulator, suf operon transcriptional repressor
VTGTDAQTADAQTASSRIQSVHLQPAPITPPQRRVLVALKRGGELTADELAEALEISASGVRQHLSALRAAGYVDSRQERGQPGRPADRFSTTEQTEALFSRSTGDLSIELLSHLEEEDPALVTMVFERRRRRRVEEAQDRLAGKTVHEKVAVLAELLDAEGYLADFLEDQPGHFRINLHSCAIWAIAARYGQACNTELEFLRDLVPEAKVDRVTHKTAGAHTCVYEIVF